MKKKLIAIVTSLAMVATMVPATAFAAVSAEGGNSSLGNGVVMQLDKDVAITVGDNTDAQTAIRNSMENLDATYSGGKLVLKGWIPYSQLSATPTGWLYNTTELNEGHFIAYKKFVPAVPDVTKIVNFSTSVEQDYKTGGQTTGDNYPKYRINKMSVVTPGEWATSISRLDEEANKTMSTKLLYLSSTGANRLTTEQTAEDAASTAAASDDNKTPAEKKALAAKTTIRPFSGAYNETVAPDAVGPWRFASETDLANKLNGKTPAQIGYNSYDQLNDLITGSTAAPESAKYVLGEKTLTVDYKNVTLLSEKDTKQVADFVDSVAGLRTHTGTIDAADTVDAKYIRLTTMARNAYDGLTGDQKAAVDYAVNNETGSDEETAYNDLLQAEKNVKAYNSLTEVAELVKAVPDAATLNLTDADAVAKVQAAKKAVTALPAGVLATLKDAREGYLTAAQWANYESAVTKVDAGVATEVEKKIDTLKDLPNAFTDQESVETYAKPWKETYDAYDELTPDQKSSLSNGSKLINYTESYKTLLTKYVNPIYAAAAEYDVEKGLTDEECAKVAELKAYIDNEYIETSEIKDFDKKVYAKLVEALEQTAKDSSSLENATIAAIADQSYTGKAIEPAVTVTDKAGKEIAAEEYTVIYSNNKDAGTATVTVAAKSSSAYTGSVSATFTITPAALTADMVKVANATYTGKAVKPAVSVASGVDYTVAYKNNTAVGKASAVVTGTGNYTGTITKNFIVKPAKESITSLKAGKKQI
ncbi:MAG: hypothetical protein HFE76_17055, partial [Firmicutes bacterium]|nr:hypothetical protein [Bacillota bacterium]